MVGFPSAPGAAANVALSNVGSVAVRLVPVHPGPIVCQAI